MQGTIHVPFAGAMRVLVRVPLAGSLLKIACSPSCWRMLFFSGLVITFFMGVIFPMPGGAAGAASDHDKLIHTAVFFALALIGTIGRFERRLIVGILVIHGSLIEILQGLNPNRSADIHDFFADVLGITLAMAICWLSLRVIGFKRS